MADTTDQTIHLFFEEPTLTSAPERIPVLPTPGTYPHPTYGELDFGADTIAQFVSNFADGVYGQQLPIDVEHDHLSGAAGYIKELHTNENGSVDASVEWTPMGKQLLAEDRFRYISPTVLTKWTSPATRATHSNVLTGAALTTRPYFKTASLRPLITASEPVVTSPVEGITMSEKTPEQTAAEAEASKIVEQTFGAKLAEAHAANEQLKAQALTFSEQLTVAQAEITALKDAANERTFRDKLKGLPESEVNRRLEVLRDPSKLEEFLFAEAQEVIQMRQAVVNRGPIGSSAPADRSQAEDLIAKKTSEVMASEPSLTPGQAKSKATSLVFKERPDLYRESRAN